MDKNIPSFSQHFASSMALRCPDLPQRGDICHMDELCLDELEVSRQVPIISTTMTRTCSGFCSALWIGVSYCSTLQRDVAWLPLAFLDTI